jgi:hypothetical protein
MSVKNARVFEKRGHSPCWPVSGLTELLSTPSHALVQGAQWLVLKAECFLINPRKAFVRLPLRGQRRLEIAALASLLARMALISSCFPLNCRV